MKYARKITACLLALTMLFSLCACASSSLSEEKTGEELESAAVETKEEKKGEELKKFPDILNIAACCVPLGHGIGRLGCFFAGCCHGKESDAWYAVRMYTENGYQSVIPVQLFEAIFLLFLAGILLFIFLKI